MVKQNNITKSANQDPVTSSMVQLKFHKPASFSIFGIVVDGYYLKGLLKNALEAGMNANTYIALGTMIVFILIFIYSGVGWSLSYLKLQRKDLAKFLIVYFGSIGLISGILFWQFGNTDIVTAEMVKKLDVVSDQEFINQEVKVDGKRFINCVFVNVTLVTDGGPNIIEADCKFVGFPGIHSDDPKAARVMKFTTNILELNEKLPPNVRILSKEK